MIASNKNSCVVGIPRASQCEGKAYVYPYSRVCLRTAWLLKALQLCSVYFGSSYEAAVTRPWRATACPAQSSTNLHGRDVVVAREGLVNLGEHHTGLAYRTVPHHNALHLFQIEHLGWQTKAL